MLRQIENLEEKPCQGDHLNPDVGVNTFTGLTDTTTSTTNQLHYTYKSCWGLSTTICTVYYKTNTATTHDTRPPLPPQTGYTTYKSVGGYPSQQVARLLLLFDIHPNRYCPADGHSLSASSSTAAGSMLVHGAHSRFWFILEVRARIS